MDKDKILQAVRYQEQICLKTRDRLIGLRNNPNDSKAFVYERAKLIGMLDILDLLQIDRSEFNWIFKI
jgi:hypothetical protein